MLVARTPSDVAIAAPALGGQTPAAADLVACVALPHAASAAAATHGETIITQIGSRRPVDNPAIPAIVLLHVADRQRPFSEREQRSDARAVRGEDACAAVAHERDDREARARPVGTKRHALKAVFAAPDGTDTGEPANTE